ncbi:DNA damage-inducible protein 1 [Allomyces javanicus]|nr:DNA damage-inducible protein 1 [Allomyces javanicus]
MDDPPHDLILGLDLMTQHEACIDLKARALRIADVEIPFLTGHELPESMRASIAQPTVLPATTQASAPTPLPPLAPASPANALPVKVSEEDIQKLVEIGATRNNAVLFLKHAHGDIELAAGLLFSNI